MLKKSKEKLFITNDGPVFTDNTTADKFNGSNNGKVNILSFSTPSCAIN
ncbi:MAG: hypothetical protein IPP73_11190 [Chitinophagaceae bacterium]|nr:hypothetical protein [Chitinophagaceae bacterium]